MTDVANSVPEDSREEGHRRGGETSPEWLRSFLLALHDPVAVFDENGCILLGNRPFRLLFGGGGDTERLRDHELWDRLTAGTASRRPGDGPTADFSFRARDGHEVRGRVTVVSLTAAGSAQSVFVALFCLTDPHGVSAFESFASELTLRIRAMKAALERFEESSGGGLPASDGSDDDLGAGLAPAVGERLLLLSERERQVVTELVSGKRIPSIAATLYLSENTVRNYLKRVYRKVGVHSAAELREILTASPGPLGVGRRPHHRPSFVRTGRRADGAAAGASTRRSAAVLP